MDLDELKKDWEKLCQQLGEAYADGEKMDIDGMLFLVGINELGKGPGSFKKDQKLELMHIAICTVLEPYGYYEFDGEDQDGWPHYTSVSYTHLTLPTIYSV